MNKFVVLLSALAWLISGCQSPFSSHPKSLTPERSYRLRRMAENNLAWSHFSNLSANRLFQAIEENDEPMVRHLLERRINPNARQDLGHPALHHAIYERNFQIVNVLIAFGADVNIQTADGHTPLMCAAWNHDAKIVKLLLQHGAKVNLRDQHGMTALLGVAVGANRSMMLGLEASIEAQMSDLEIAETLILHGANINAKDRSGSAALDDAKETMKYVPEHRKMVDLLLKYGARSGQK